ncbi:hypothetical protein M1L60_23550 [Actinoplanes sp. TRM 88003]|uniref:Uncharacterized protein n=1 Tax=Paractinoplanes aksuensis TaxID=2939490 RepID=A0ABT1DRW4_9ACTN|nr:hypothetical protein [Actinoplanes aksuensis]MCO8273575.1 hypothetical protein [Actinoplanes aksuensis]
MLSDRDRLLLAPHLVSLRAAQKELAAARLSFEAAAQGLTESAGSTDWRDRVLGGLFSADDGRTQRFRQSREAHKTAGKALAEAEAKYAKYAERIDGLLDPLLFRDDPGYRARAEAVGVCDKALSACEKLRWQISSTLKLSESREDEMARQQRTELLQEMRRQVPGLRRTIERAAQAVGESPPPVGHGPAMRQPRELRVQLEAAIREIGRWRDDAEQVRVAALRAAHESL